MRPSLTILSYHNVDHTWAFPSGPGRAPAGFRAQLDWLARFTNVVALEPALAALAGGRPLPPRALAITFDDGYRDNLEIAAPELRLRAMPATFFLVPGLIDRAVTPWWERLAWGIRAARATAISLDGTDWPLVTAADRASTAREVTRLLKASDRQTREARIDEIVAALDAGHEPNFGALYVDWDGARRLGDMGFELGSHSSWHAILGNETPEAQLADLTRSRQRLEAELDRPIRTLAYPNGTVHDYSAATVTAAVEAGFTHACTTRIGRNTGATPPFELRRFVVVPERGVSPLRWSTALGQRAVRVARRRFGRLGPRTRPSGGEST